MQTNRDDDACGPGPRRGLQRRALLAALTGLSAALVRPRSSLAAQAVDFPARAVRIVVPYSVGIGPDVVARCVAERLALQWQRPVLVDNRPGASGILAFGELRRTPADGHTLFLADTATLVVNPLLHASLPYDPGRDLAPLTMLFRATFVLWVGAANRFRTVAALLDAARRAPGGVSYATLGNGHASHVAVETLARAAAVRMLHVPFKDAGALLGAVANGDVDFTAIGVNSVAGLMASGRLRPLAVAATNRLASHPQIPTLVEAGGPPVEMHPWAALVAVAGTPASVLDRLQHDIVTALAADDVRARVEQAGFELTPSTPQAVLERMRADRALYEPLVSEGRVARL
jgi:tripartite-type tricarboxylate transporter receptor subunit TctC